MHHLTKTVVVLFFVAVGSVGWAAPMRVDSTGKDTTKYNHFKDLPLKPQRTIQFTTTEGTWTSLDVSPDGKTLVFDMMGDLFTVPMTGGKAVALTQGIA